MEFNVESLEIARHHLGLLELLGDALRLNLCVDECADERRALPDDQVATEHERLRGKERAAGERTVGPPAIAPARIVSAARSAASHGTTPAAHAAAAPAAHPAAAHAPACAT